MKSRLKGLMLTTALVALTAAPSFAQDSENPFLRGRYTAVTERDQPEFDPEPMRVSTFDVLASLGVSAAYNDNIFATPNNERATRSCAPSRPSRPAPTGRCMK